ncbi:MAG: class I SAM-dependent methyltransferase, partial [Pseudomonadota bacterium]
MGLYRDHIGPWLIDRACSSRQLNAERHRALSAVEGTVVELGAGSGANLIHYDADHITDLIAIEPNPALVERLRPKLADVQFPARIEVARAEELPVETASIDTVAVTFTLCSIADIATALSEARRVLKPSGRLVFLEHGKAESRSAQRVQSFLAPIWKPIALGCHLARDPVFELEAAGFAIDKVDTYRLSGAPAFAATPKRNRLPNRRKKALHALGASALGLAVFEKDEP